MEYFMNFQKKLSESKIVILPIPHEKTTSYGKGTKDGPKSILKASYELENYNLETNSEPYTKGIYTEKYTKLKDIKKYKNKFIIALGGEHSITPKLIKNIDKKEFSVLQIDAHADLKDTFENKKDSHACAARRIFEINQNLTQVGIRSLDKKEKEFIEKNNIKTFFMKDILDDGTHELEIISNLKKNVYITIDVDGFDPSVIPSLGNPEPGGLTWKQVIDLLKKVFKERNVIGMDITELSPKKEDLVSPYTISKLIYHCIGFKYGA